MKKSIVFLTLLMWSSFLNAQVGNLTDALGKSFEVVSEKIGKNKFKGQILKGKKNGMGFIFYKNNSLFTGDFYRDDISGFGFLFSQAPINNCEGAIAYVGNWKEGVKSGFGRCYAEDGKVIYQGQFEKDKPTGAYPSVNISSPKTFSIIDLQDGQYYIGEVKDGMPDGFGMQVFSNGDLWQSSYKEGQKKGIGLYLAYNGEWETINVKGNDFAVVSSSENYRQMDAVRKQNFRSSWSEALTKFGEAAQSTVTLIGSIRNNTSGGGSLASDAAFSGSSMTSGKSSGSNSSNMSKGHTGSEAQAKNRDSNTYSDYESQLIKMNTYYESQYNDSHRRNIQQSMKKIRNKWESRGFQMFHSPWEDWNGSKR